MKLNYLLLILAFFSCMAGAKGEKHFVMNGNDDGDHSMRSLIDIANPGDTIVFAPNIDEIMLTSNELLIQKTLSIIGSCNRTRIVRSSGVPAFRIFHFINSGVIHLINLEINNGLAPIAAGYYPQFGGGICINDTNSILYVDNCLIHNNSAASGVNNNMGPWGYAGGCGGGIYNAGFLYIERSKIYNNKAGNGGSNSLPKKGEPLDCVSFTGGSGGAIFTTHRLEIVDCMLYGNIAGRGGFCSDFYGPNPADGGHGGGIYVSSGTALFLNCLIYGNTSGDAFCSGPGTSLPIYGANTGNGGGIFNNSQAIIINSTIVYNSIPLSVYNYYGTIHYCNGLGPGVCNSAGGISFIRNSLLYGNNYRQEGYLYNDVYASDSGNIDLRYSLAGEINWNDYSVGNFINKNPSFIDSSDFHLAFNSPCINAGDPDTAGLPSMDLAGMPRVVENRVDMGAYEFQGYSWIQNNTPNREIFVYPNPCTDKITIFIPEYLKNSVLEVHLMDVAGQVLSGYRIEKGSSSFFISLPASLPKGIFYLEARTSDHVSVHKIIKL